MTGLRERLPAKRFAKWSRFNLLCDVDYTVTLSTLGTETSLPLSAHRAMSDIVPNVRA